MINCCKDNNDTSLKEDVTSELGKYKAICNDSIEHIKQLNQKNIELDEKVKNVKSKLSTLQLESKNKKVFPDINKELYNVGNHTEKLIASLEDKITILKQLNDVMKKLLLVKTIERKNTKCFKNLRNSLKRK